MEAHAGSGGSDARQVRGFCDLARHQSSWEIRGTDAREPGGTAGQAEGFWMIFPRRGAETQRKCGEFRMAEALSSDGTWAYGQVGTNAEEAEALRASAGEIPR